MSACTRVLAATLDANPPLDEAATLGGLRAVGDRLALRERFHDPAVDRHHRPEDARASIVFSALELARLDAIGVHWLAGMARNLLAHPGSDEDGMRWLAFEIFSGRPAPDSKRALTDAARNRLPFALITALQGLGADRLAQRQFAAGAAAWSIEAARHLTFEAITKAGRQQILLPTRSVERRQRRPPGSPDGVASRQGRRPPTDRHGEGAGAQPLMSERSPHAGPERYRVFTTAHDRVVNAAALATREELAGLRVALENDASTIRTVVARLAKRLLRVLMARQMRQWQFDLEEGQLDGSRLAVLVASRGRARPFKQERDSPFPSTVVTLLIDHSGSMRGRPMRIAALTVEILARVLERCGVRCEVLGFTTREWDGGEPAREWAAAGYPEQPGRLNALEHIIIKSADTPWRRARMGLGLSLHDEMLKENIDGEALRWAHARLLARSESRRILIVVSDGTPMDEATLAANGYDYLDQHLAAVVDDIEARSPVQLAAIGIGHDVSHVYRTATKIATVDDLGPAITRKLVALLTADDDR